jgi:hypothetical protein
MMSKVAAEQMGNAACNDEGLSFAVFHLHEMLLNLEKNYHAAWDGEVPSLVEGSPPSTRDIKKLVIKTVQGTDKAPPSVA